MLIKPGTIVSHSGALEWGSGKVLEVNAAMANIHFSDGLNRKIAASHFFILQPAAAVSYVPPPDAVIEVPVRRPSTRVAKKKK
jgi:hypothetical protein